ncbi:MAG TPA: TIGR02147 family protein [Bdellovibrio sp.]|nr:TIGR02147 family protein [Bdellovibrio sp.]
MSIFNYEDFREYIQNRIKSLPKGGRGEYQKIAKILGMHTTHISQIMNGTKCFSPEQAFDLCEYFQMNELESNYLLALIEYERAGTKKLKNHIARKLQNLKKESAILAKRINKEAELSDEARAIFYSEWLYSGVRIATSIPSLQNKADLCKYFQITSEKLDSIIEFLLSYHLIVTSLEGNYQLGPQRTHLSAESPFAAVHHKNWRLKAIQHYEKMTAADLSFTSPLSISSADAGQVRELLIQTIKHISETVKNTDPENTYCINVDWFSY